MVAVYYYSELLDQGWKLMFRGNHGYIYTEMYLAILGIFIVFGSTLMAHSVKEIMSKKWDLIGNGIFIYSSILFLLSIVFSIGTMSILQPTTTWGNSSIVAPYLLLGYGLFLLIANYLLRAAKPYFECWLKIKY